MAIVSAATFKAEVANMATALTVCYKDSVEVAVALEISNNGHPLRRLDQLFLFDPVTGIVAANDAYIDAAYAGLAPSKGNELAVNTPFPVSLLTATAEDADTSAIVLTYNQNFDPALGKLLSQWSVGGTQSGNVISVSVLGRVVTVGTDLTYVLGNTITVTYTASSDPLTVLKDRKKAANLAAQAVTNNIS